MTTSTEWTDETWNPTTGCDRVSEGCDHCYIERTVPFRMEGRRFDASGRMGVRLHPDRLDKPLHWRRPRRVFVGSLSDLFHPDVPSQFIARVLGTAAAAERHTFQVLTKRPQRMASLMADESFGREVRRCWWARWAMVLDSPDPLPARRAGDPPSRPLQVDRSAARRLQWGPARRSMPLGSSNLPMPPPNLWLGVSIELDKYAWRADHLRRTPATVRFLSLEPLLGPLPSLDLTGTDWVIVGGESGPGARPMHPDWVRDIRDRCVAAGVPFFFKQWGNWRWPGTDAEWQRPGQYLHPDGSAHPWPGEWHIGEGCAAVVNLGKKAAGRTLDGRTWDEMPGPAAP